MRLIKNRSQLLAHFTLRWEIAYLAELPPQWVPFSLVGQTEPLGMIHCSAVAGKPKALF